MKGLGLDDVEVVMKGLLEDVDEGRKIFDTAASPGFIAFELNGLADCIFKENGLDC